MPEDIYESLVEQVYVDDEPLTAATDKEWEAIKDGIRDAELKIKVSVIWDTDGEDVDLPEEVEIPVEDLEYTTIEDYLSDKYEFCIESYNVEDDEED